MSERRIRSAFDRLKAETARRVSPADGLARIHGIRRWHRALAPALGFGVVAIAVFAVVVVLNGPLAETPDTVLPGVATTLTETDVTTTTTTTPPNTEAQPPSTSAPTTTSPVGPAAMPAFSPIEEGSVLIASRTGVIAVESTGPRAITTLPAELAVSDGYGGIIYQEGAFSAQARTWRLTTDGGLAELLLGEHNTIHDMAIIDGVPTLIYVSDNSRSAEAGGTADYSGTVWLMRLDAGERRPLATFPTYEGSIGRVSYGGGIFAISAGSEGETWFHIIDADGNPTGVNPRPYESGVDGAQYFEPVVSPDGTSLLFVRIEGPLSGAGEDDTTFVVWDLVNGRQIGATPLPLDEMEAWRLDFDGTTLAITRADGTGERGYGLIVDGTEIDTGTLAIASFPGTLSLAGPALERTGPVSPPTTLPIGGLEEGYLVVRSDRITWMPFGQTVDPDDVRTILATGIDRYEGGVQAVGDGNGNVIYYVARDRAISWLLDGDATELFQTGEWLRLEGVAVIEERPTLYMMLSSGAETDLWTVDLITAAAKRVGTIGSSETSVHSVSFGGGQFVVNATIGTCTELFAILPDGSPGVIANAPESTCDGLPDRHIYSARVSPDGTVLVYLEAVAEPSDFEEMTPVQWAGPVELVVRDINGGVDLHRRVVAQDPFAWVVIHDFDGRRIVVSSEPIEPAAAEQSFQIIDLQNLGDVVTFTEVLATVKLFG